MDPYALIVQGPDGEPSVERFDDLAAYRARLALLGQASEGSLSIDDLAALLDA